MFTYILFFKFYIVSHTCIFFSSKFYLARCVWQNDIFFNEKFTDQHKNWVTNLASTSWLHDCQTVLQVVKFQTLKTCYTSSQNWVWHYPITWLHLNMKCNQQIVLIVYHVLRGETPLLRTAMSWDSLCTKVFSVHIIIITWGKTSFRSKQKAETSAKSNLGHAVNSKTDI